MPSVLSQPPNDISLSLRARNLVHTLQPVCYFAPKMQEFEYTVGTFVSLSSDMQRDRTI